MTLSKNPCVSDAKIAIEFAPPSDLEKIAALKNAGADVAIMNLEVANDELRKRFARENRKFRTSIIIRRLKKRWEFSDGDRYLPC